MNEEIWKYLEGEYKIYTESKEVFSKLQLKKYQAKLSATYSKNGKEIGWDFIVSEKMVTEIKKLIKLINDTEKRNQKAKDKLKVKKNK